MTMTTGAEEQAMTTTLSSPAPAADDPIQLAVELPGRLAGGYVADRELGDTALGRVVLARGTVSDRPVVVKILAPHLAANPSVRARFLREADLAARLSHPNAVRLLAAGEGDEPFVVLEHIEGETLEQRVVNRGRLSAADTLSLATHLAAGLAHAHANGVVHGALDARSILLGRDGVARLTDFGLARVLAEASRVASTGDTDLPDQADITLVRQTAGPARDVRALAMLLRQVAGEDFPSALGAVVDAALSSEPSVWPCAVDVHHLVLTMTRPDRGVASTGGGIDLERPPRHHLCVLRCVRVGTVWDAVWLPA